MPGKVYCFNDYNERINQFNVNGGSAGGVPGWTQSGSTIYTPSSVAVPRARHGDGMGAVFPNDMPTSLRIDWDSYTAQTRLDLSALRGTSIDDDLILHIAVNQLTLMNTRGFVLVSQPINPSGM